MLHRIPSQAWCRKRESKEAGGKMMKKVDYLGMMLNGNSSFCDGVRKYGGGRSSEMDIAVTKLPSTGWIEVRDGVFNHSEYPEWEGRVWDDVNAGPNQIPFSGYFFRIYDLKKLRRRCEDALRKTATSKDLLQVAEILKVKINS